MSRLIDISGQAFNRLTALEYIGRSKNGNASLWHCVCECKNERIVSSYALRHDRIKSCGCLRTEKTIERSTKHGHGKRGGTTALYRLWKNSKSQGRIPRDLTYEQFLAANSRTVAA